MKHSLIAIIVILLGLNCHHIKPVNDSLTRQKSDSNITTIITPLEIDNKVRKVNELAQDEILDLEKQGKFDITLMEITGNQISFASDSKLIYELLGKNLTEEYLKNKYGKNLSVINQNYDFDGKIQAVKKYMYNKSFFKVYYYSETNISYLACAKILDKEIKLPFDIYIGQTRSDFFSKVFKYSDKYDFSNIDTVYCGDELGDIEQYYLFKKDTLSEIIVKSAMTWIDFELD